MTKYFGYKYLVNWPMIIEIYENPLGYFYCLLHTVRVKLDAYDFRFWTNKEQSLCFLAISIKYGFQTLDFIL